MSEGHLNQLPIIERSMVHLGGVIHAIGLSYPYARQIVKRAIADEPSTAPADIEAKARAWMLIALA